MVATEYATMMLPIAVTGRGLLSSNAHSPAEFAEALRQGRSGIGPLATLDPSPYYCQQAGEVRDLTPDGRLPRGRVFQLLRHAVEQAVGEAGPQWLRENAETTGIIIGTTSASGSAKEALLASGRSPRVPSAEGAGAADADPAAASSFANASSSVDARTEDELLDEVPFESLSTPIARHYGLGGPVAITSVSCTSGGSAVGLALASMLSGDATSMIAAACEAIGIASFAGFTAVRAMARESCRPFDRRRDGMIIGEGATALVLEPADLARQRGARIHAEILGFGCCNDAYHSVMPHPKGEGLAASIWQALTMAGLSPNDIDLICAHGTATALNDAMEQAAYRRVFGERVRSIPVTAIKPFVGHTLGAAGGVELLATICALEGGFVPPVLGYEVADDGCPLWVVHGSGLQRDLRYALCCNSAFAGNNTAVVVGRAKQTGVQEHQ